LAQSAAADNLTVANGTVITTPLATSSAANNSAGDITIEQGATLRIGGRERRLASPAAAPAITGFCSTAHPLLPGISGSSPAPRSLYMARTRSGLPSMLR
jgi:hypothetical protein